MPIDEMVEDIGKLIKADEPFVLKLFTIKSVLFKLQKEIEAKKDKEWVESLHSYISPNGFDSKKGKIIRDFLKNFNHYKNKK